jgi:plastocyanin
MGLTRSRRPFLAALLAGAFLAGLSGLTLADGPISISSTGFSPQTLTVTAGDMVTWSNADTQPHTATADKGSFDTGPIAPGKVATVTFLEAGAFTYADQDEPRDTGTIIVIAAAQPTPSHRSPPPTDLASDLANGDTTTGTGLLIGLTLLAAAALLSTVRLAAVRRGVTLRWIVLLPGQAPGRSSSSNIDHRQADQWNRDDHPPT